MSSPFTTGAAVRAACRAGTLTRPTPGLAPGFVQTNLVVLPTDWMREFLHFCEFNPRPCPIVDVIPAGQIGPQGVAPGADIRTDLPAYRVFVNGECVEEPTHVLRHWRDDLAGVLLGCSFTFENALLATGPYRSGTSNRGGTCRCIARTSRAHRPSGSTGRWWCPCGR